jgi:hypothetical protein
MMILSGSVHMKGVQMILKRFFAIFASICLISLSACNMPGGPSVIDGPNQVPTAGIQTQVAGIMASTSAAATALSNAVAGTLAAMATNTPIFTYTPSLSPTPSLTSTPTFTLTPSVPMVSVSVQTNCRTGPGSIYDILGVLGVGKTAEVVGRSVYNDTWIIKLPSNPAITCWLWGQYATVTGNTTGLPSFNPPPTPTPKVTNTPAPGFSVSFVDTTYCAPEYAFQFQVNNTGGITWESIKLVITDNTASTTTTHTADSFRSYETCSLESSQENLEPGEGAHVANYNPGQLDYNPSGHDFTANVKVCSQNGLAGTCLEKTINFTP